MTRPTPDEIDQLRIDLYVAETLVTECADSFPEAIRRVVQWAVQQPLQSPFEDPVQDAMPPIDPHRAAHRVGSPSRIDTDPELTAFIRARIDRLTFKDIAAEIAGHFPPDRRASVSGLHRWFHRQKRHAGAR